MTQELLYDTNWHLSFTVANADLRQPGIIRSRSVRDYLPLFITPRLGRNPSVYQGKTLPMPATNLVLMLLIGLTFGGVSAVFLRARKGGFLVNIILGVAGAAIGALLPVLIGASAQVDVTNYNYLLRALMGSFLFVVVFSLFRSAKPRGR